MLKEKERTMEVYIKAGAYARLWYNIGVKTIVTIQDIIPRNEVAKLDTIITKIAKIKSKADGQLINDYPNLGNGGYCVFYGAPDVNPKNELDIKVLQTMRQEVIKLFGDNWEI